MTPDRRQLRAFAERYTAAWCSMDPRRVAEHYAPEGRLIPRPGQAAVALNRRPTRKPTAAAPRPIATIFRPFLRQSPTRVSAE